MKPVVVSRSEFEKSVRTVPLEVATLAKDTRLAGVDVKKADLDGDGKISGKKEARALFAVLDAMETNKVAASLELINGEGKSTPTGPRMEALRDAAKTSPHRPNAPGPTPPVSDAVRSQQRYPVDPQRAFERSTHHNTAQIYAWARGAMKDLGIRFTPNRDDLLLDTLRHSGKMTQVFGDIASNLEDKVKSGKMSRQQGEALLQESYVRFLRAGGHGDDLMARLQQSPLAEGFKKRDTDGDGVVDIKELAKGTDVYENTRISAAAGRDTIEARKQALEDHLHNPVRAHPKKGEGTHQTYVGDQGVGYAGKNNGYVYFTPKTVQLGSKTYTIPDKLDVGGKSTTVKPAVAETFQGRTVEGFVVTRGDQKLLAVPGANNSFTYYRPTSTTTNDTVQIGGKAWSPTHGSVDTKEWDVVIGFEHAYVAANTGRARVSSEEYDLRTQQFAEARSGETHAIVSQLDAATRASIDGSIGRLDSSAAKLKVETQKFLEHYKDIAGLQASGLVKVDIDDQTGKVALTMQKGPLSQGDFDKLVAKFGAKVKMFEESMNKNGSIALADTIRAREAEAAQLYSYTSSRDYVTHLESLKPEQRTAEIARISQALVGTKAGAKFAEDLDRGMQGLDQPWTRPGIVRLVLDEPTPRSATTSGNLAAVAQVASSTVKWKTDEMRHEMYFELVQGRKPNAEEKKVIAELVKAQDKAQQHPVEAARGPLLEKYMKDVFNKYPGPTSHVFHAYAHTMHHAFEHAPSVHKTADWAKKYPGGAVAAEGHHVPSWGQKGVMIGAAGFSVVSFGHSLHHAFEHPTVGTVAHAGVEFANMGVMLAGTAESFMAAGGAPKFLKNVGKYGGPIVAGAHVVMDIANYTTKNSEEGKDRAMGQIAGSGMLLAGALLASNPAGWALAAGGLLVKLFAGDTDPNYEAAYGALDSLPYGHWK